MDESRTSSTSDKPPIEKLGLDTLITGTAPFDPITTDTAVQPSGSSQKTPDAGSDPLLEGAAEGVLQEVVTTYDEAEVGNSIERELFQLTIGHAEIDAAIKRLEADVVEVEGKDVRTLNEENLDEEKTEKDEENVEEETDGGDEGNDIKMVKNNHHAESVEEENVFCDEEDDRNVEGQSGEVVTNIGRHNHSNDRRRINYPMRPDAEDCAYYMKTGSCKFGLSCKFNHPPRRKNQSIKEEAKQREENSEKSGRTECKGEKECPYYMRTGSCKYASNCRFHHPDPTTVAGGGSPSGYDNGGSLPSQLVSSSSISSWSSPRALTDTSPFVPVVFPPNQGAPTPSPEWNGYQDEPICTHYHRFGICKYGPACKYDHPSKSAISPPSFEEPPY